MYIVYYKTFDHQWCNGYCSDKFYDDGKCNYWLIPGTYAE